MVCHQTLIPPAESAVEELRSLLLSKDAPTELMLDWLIAAIEELMRSERRVELAGARWVLCTGIADVTSIAFRSGYREELRRERLRRGR